MPRVSTLNEPWCSSILSYDLGYHAPGHNDRAEGLQAAHHLMLASGLGLRAMRAERSDQSLGLVQFRGVAGANRFVSGRSLMAGPEGGSSLGLAVNY